MAPQLAKNLDPTSTRESTLAWSRRGLHAIGTALTVHAHTFTQYEFTYVKVTPHFATDDGIAGAHTHSR